MSIRERIIFNSKFDPEKYLAILKEDHGAINHPAQAGALIVDGLPFYKPQEVDESISVVSFNHVPLPDTLIVALTNYPDLVPDSTLVLWLIEEDLYFESTMGEIRTRLK